MKNNNPLKNFDEQIVIIDDFESITKRAADEILKHCLKKTNQKGIYSIALSGGSTPKHLYSILADKNKSYLGNMPWKNIHFFWGDERNVPHDNNESNYRMVKESIFSKVPIDSKNIHPIPTENNDAEKIALSYDLTLRSFFKLKNKELPIFDLILLGMGDDAHTASLFPESEALNEKKKLVVSTWIKKFNSSRITITPPVINNATFIIFLVSGKNKAEALKNVLKGDHNPTKFPAQLIKPTNGKLLWLVDKAAGKLL